MNFSFFLIIKIKQFTIITVRISRTRSCTDMHTTACCSVLCSMQRIIVLLIQQTVLYHCFSVRSMFARIFVSRCIRIKFPRPVRSQVSHPLAKQHRVAHLKFLHHAKNLRLCLTFKSRSVDGPFFPSQHQCH